MADLIVFSSIQSKVSSLQRIVYQPKNEIVTLSGQVIIELAALGKLWQICLACCSDGLEYLIWPGPKLEKA